jgi:hypothetical protein
MVSSQADWDKSQSPIDMVGKLFTRPKASQQAVHVSQKQRRLCHLASVLYYEKALELYEQHLFNLAEAWATGTAPRPSLADLRPLYDRVLEAHFLVPETDLDDGARFGRFNLLRGGSPVPCLELGDLLLAHPGALREVIPSPFRGRPRPQGRPWLTRQVHLLAASCLKHRWHGKLPEERLGILADALEEAGCDEPDRLEHLHGPGPHPTGCWAVFDLARRPKRPQAHV